MSTKTLGKRKTREGETESDNHGSTLFVSNLPYNATSTDLQTAFSDLAPVRSAFVVLERGSDISKGVGYVSFSIREDARVAYEAIVAGGMTIDGRKIRVQWAERKRKHGTTDRPQAENVKKEEGAVGRCVGAHRGDSPVRTSVVSTSGDQTIEWEGLRKRSHESSEDEDEDSGREEEGSAEEDEEDGEDSEPFERDDGGESPMKLQLPHTDTGSTLFIRNVPFTAIEDEIRTLFRAFGPLRYVRLTVDPETERPRGTGFACFWNKEDADKAIQQSNILRCETMGTQTQPPKNPFSLPSLLTPDPSAGLAKNLVLHGRTLDVVRAVTREQATKLKEDGEKRREKQDKRNLYLLREGVILPNSPAAATIPQAELEKRTNSFNARRTMLRSNPSLYVSKTRLSVRQLPLFVTERVLKRLALHSVRAFDADVKQGVREDLFPDELAEPAMTDDHDVVKTEGDAGSKRHVSKAARVRQAKIIRQSDRVDPISGKGRSRGYGFVEMHTHADALRVLRWANNNADVGALLDTWWKEELVELVAKEKDEARVKRMKGEMEGSNRSGKRTLIVEFSIENVQVVQRRTAQREKMSQPHHGGKSDPEEPVSKKRRVSSDGIKPVKTVRFKEESDKPRKHIGSVIGRKRRARKAGKDAR